MNRYKRIFIYLTLVSLSHALWGFSSSSVNPELLVDLGNNLSIGSYSYSETSAVGISKYIPLNTASLEIGIFSQMLNKEEYLTNITSDIGLEFQLNFGKPLDSHQEERRHSIGYSLKYIVGSDGTNQPHGGLLYKYNRDELNFNMELGYDLYYFTDVDEYKTTKGLIGFGKENWGMYTGVLLWTGDLDTTNFINEFNLVKYSIPDYSTDNTQGFLVMGIELNSMFLSVGYESYTILNLLQNGIDAFDTMKSISDGEENIYISFSFNKTI